MRLIPTLLLAGLCLPVPALAQKDTVFKDVEFLSGKKDIPDKGKGTLIVATTEIRLVDKREGAPYLTIPFSEIETSKTIVYDEKEDKAKETIKKGLGSLGGLFGGGPENRLLLTVRRDSATSDTVVFKLHKEKEVPEIAATIKARLDAAKELASRPLMLIANPYTDAGADSATAVQIGSAMREELTKFVGDKFRVVTREQMNGVLTPYGYPPDAILSPALTETLASEIQAAVVISGTLTKGENGRYTVKASLNATGAQPGTPVTVEQNDKEKLDAFGRRVAEALK